MVLHLIMVLAAMADIEKHLYKPKTLEILKKNHVQHGNYYSALSLADKMWFKAEEDFLRQRYGIERTPAERLDKMMATNPGEKIMTRIPFYDMLAN
jgi:hypothetical protein